MPGGFEDKNMPRYISTLAHRSCELQDWRPINEARIQAGFQLCGSINDPASITGFSNEFEGPELTEEEKERLYFE